MSFASMLKGKNEPLTNDDGFEYWADFCDCLDFAYRDAGAGTCQRFTNTARMVIEKVMVLDPMPESLKTYVATLKEMIAEHPHTVLDDDEEEEE